MKILYYNLNICTREYRNSLFIESAVAIGTQGNASNNSKYKNDKPHGRKVIAKIIKISIIHYLS